jgi:hypothetical protein
VNTESSVGSKAPLEVVDCNEIKLVEEHPIPVVVPFISPLSMAPY